MNIDLLKRPAIFGTIIGAIVLLLLWWFVWMSPEGNKLSSVNAQESSLQAQISSLNTTIAGLKQQSALVPSELPYLAKFTSAVPDLPESGVLTEQLYNLMNQTHTFISSLSDATVTATTEGYSTIPVSLVVVGSHDSVMSFIQGIYNLPRLVTIQTLTLTPATGGTTTNLLKMSGAPGFSGSITGTAYTTFIPPAPAAPPAA